MAKGQLIVISGPSGVGKGTVVKQLFKDFDGFALSVSVTTRAPRPGEKDGVDYFFKTFEEYQKMMSNNEFLETAEVYGNHYGTPKSGVDKLIDEGKNVILEIDTVGAENVKKMYPDSVLIFIIPPTIEQLKQRLTNRRTESEEALTIRLGAAIREIGKMKIYDYVVVNEDPSVAAKDIMAIVRASYCSIGRNSIIVNKFLGGKL